MNKKQLKDASFMACCLRDFLQQTSEYKNLPIKEKLDYDSALCLLINFALDQAKELEE